MDRRRVRNILQLVGARSWTRTPKINLSHHLALHALQASNPKALFQRGDEQEIMEAIENRPLAGQVLANSSDEQVAFAIHVLLESK